jgi:hypothetical protein
MPTTLGWFHGIHVNMLQVVGVIRAGKSKAVSRWRDLNEVDLYVSGILMLKAIQIMANEHFRLCAFIPGCVYRQEGSWWDQYDDR